MTDFKKKCLNEKKYLIDGVNDILNKLHTNVEKIDYEVYENDKKSYSEFIVFTYKGGNIGIIENTANSISSTLKAISEGMNGNSYNCLEFYELFKAQSNRIIL